LANDSLGDSLQFGFEPALNGSLKVRRPHQRTSFHPAVKSVVSLFPRHICPAMGDLLQKGQIF
jgi:hypothetical protein